MPAAIAMEGGQSEEVLIGFEASELAGAFEAQLELAAS